MRLRTAGVLRGVGDRGGMRGSQYVSLRRFWIFCCAAWHRRPVGCDAESQGYLKLLTVDRDDRSCLPFADAATLSFACRVYFMTSPLAVEVEELTKVYGKIKALDRVSFAIPSGQIVGLLGHNGAG